MRMLLWLAMLALTAQASAESTTSTIGTRGQYPVPSKWEGAFRYGLASDFADSRKPRAYSHVMVGEVGYKATPNWSIETEASIRYETINGQIPKGQEESYSETLHPAAEMKLDYSNSIINRHAYSFFGHVEPLFDDDARREGYQALIGAGGALALNFFNKRLTLTQVLDGTGMVNTYTYGSDLKANPDYFWVYDIKGDIRFAKSYKFSVSFGAKLTRYLDGFMGYSYKNSVSFSKTWSDFSAMVAYDNGGYTDDGYIRMWYVDEYRRIARLMVAYAF